MKRVFSGKPLGVLISSAVVSTGIALACAGGWGEEYGVSNFTPEIFVDSIYSPFFYSDMFYYKIGHDENQNTRFNSSNISEWSGYLKKQVDSTTLEFLLQQASPGAIDTALQFVRGKSANASSLQKYNLAKQKNNPKFIAFLEYLRLAKKAEAFAVNDQDWWNYEPNKKKNISYDVSAFNRDLLNGFNKAKDAFLKQRYWFQLGRSYFFNGSPQQVITLFNGNEKSMPRNALFYRSLAYTAGAYYKLKDFSKANYYFSRVYNACNELKTTAHYSFHPQEETDWKATLALCQNKDEQATLWQMLGIFYSDEKRAIEKIYELNPKSEKLDLLLSRAVNKYEQKFGDNGNPYEMPVDTSANAGAYLHTLITKIAEAGNTRQPWIWLMAAGYLNTLDEKYDAANNFYSKSAKILPGQKWPQAQLRLLKLINTIGSARQIDPKTENEVLNDIKWLRDFDGTGSPEFRYSDAFSWVKRVMASKYNKQKDWVKAECYSSDVNFYTDNNKIEALKLFLNKKDKTPYEYLLESLSSKRLEDLLEFQAIRATYEEKTDAAIEKMQQTIVASTKGLPGNPFNGRIQDCHDCDHQAAQKIKYSKLSFLQKLKELTEKTMKGDDVYNNALLMGHAYYNISHFGNARAFYECKILGESHSSPYFLDSAFQPMLTSNHLAFKYYKMALNAAANDEQKAKCSYMLAKCERNAWYNDHIYNNPEHKYDEGFMVDLKVLSGFKLLQQYPNTQYYKEVIMECGYFKTYTTR